MTKCAYSTNNKKEVLVDTINLTPEDEVNASRSRMYNLLSLAFSFPKESLQSIQAELWELAATLYPDMDINKEVVDFSSKEMEQEYINVFDGHEQAVYCKPYEGLWETGDSAKRQWEVKKFYSFFGLGLNEQLNEVPDHIMYEMEFMHFLIFNMVDHKDQHEHFLRAQKDFLERHLSQWITPFCNLLTEKTSIPFYKQLASVTNQFITDDLEWVQSQYEEAGSGSV